MVIQTFPIPGNWREEFEKAKSEGTGNGAPAMNEGTGNGAPARTAAEPLENKHVKMPQTKSGKPRFASRSDGVEAGIVNGGFVPPTLDN